MNRDRKRSRVGLRRISPYRKILRLLGSLQVEDDGFILVLCVAGYAYGCIDGSIRRSVPEPDPMWDSAAFLDSYSDPSIHMSTSSYKLSRHSSPVLPSYKGEGLTNLVERRNGTTAIMQQKHRGRWFLAACPWPYS